ncbi:MAG: hypothetical protein QGI09_08830 [Dehalococcoidia bacterium]|nr:hypothetical protein [Dehalococcoidia bacterium]
MGVKEVIFLDHADGELAPDQALKTELGMPHQSSPPPAAAHLGPLVTLPSPFRPSGRGRILPAQGQI